MQSATNPKGVAAPSDRRATTAGGENKRNAYRRHVIEVVLWIISLVVLLVSSVMVHLHPGPWPIDLQTTIALQHIQYPTWVSTIIANISHLNDPIPATIALIAWFVVLLIFRRWQAAIFIGIGTTLADWIDFVDNMLVHRPRPHSPLIHVYQPEPIPSFPSGHAEHDVVYYGFLLYLSFTKPVREWRYHWILIPFQVFAVIIILTIGYSRIAEGSHWLTDILGGYLSGALLLVVLIWLYRWTTARRAEHRARKQAMVKQPSRRAMRE